MSSDDNSSSDDGKKIAINLISGMCAGSVNVLVGLPMDTVKVKMQTFPQENPGMMRCFVSTVRTDGIFRGLYAGAIPSLVANVGENAILFVAYRQCQGLVADLRGFRTPGEMDPLSNALSGSMAAFFSAMWLCPTEHIKCQLQVRRELSKNRPDMKMQGPFQLTREIVRRDGVRELFRGLKPTWSRELPGYFFFFGGYESTKVILSRLLDTPKDQLGLGPQLICGAMAGVTFWTGIFPLDVIKSRIQVMGQSGSMLDVAKSVWRQQGLRGFYNGLAPCIVRAFPATASLLATFEYTSHFLTRRWCEG